MKNTWRLKEVIILPEFNTVATGIVTLYLGTPSRVRYLDLRDRKC